MLLNWIGENRGKKYREEQGNEEKEDEELKDERI